jgi:hypothetical protein
MRAGLDEFGFTLVRMEARICWDVDRYVCVDIFLIFVCCCVCVKSLLCVFLVVACW